MDKNFQYADVMCHNIQAISRKGYNISSKIDTINQGLNRNYLCICCHLFIW